MRFRNGRGLTAVITTIGALAAVSAGCGDSESSSTSSASSAGEEAAQASDLKSIAYGNLTDASPLYRSIGEELVKLGDRDGITVSRFDNKTDPAVTLQNARQMVQLNPDVLVEWSPSADANTAIARQFERSGKPCVAVNAPITGCAWLNISNLELGRGLGPVAAAEAADRGWTADDTTVVVVGVPATGALNLDLIRGFYERFAPDFPGQREVASDDITATTTRIGDNVLLLDGKGQLDISNRVMQQALQRISEGRHIVLMTANDDSAQGALRAIDQAGRSDDTIAVSAGGSVEALEQLRTNPSWVGEASVFIDVWPQYMLALAKAVHAGAETPELTPAPQMTVTKDNVDEYFGADGAVKKAPPIPEEARYLREYGLGSS